MGGGCAAVGRSRLQCAGLRQHTHVSVCSQGNMEQVTNGHDSEARETLGCFVLHGGHNVSVCW